MSSIKTKDTFWNTVEQTHTYYPFDIGMTKHRLKCKLLFGNDIKIRRFRRFKSDSGEVRFTAEFGI